MPDFFQTQEGANRKRHSLVKPFSFAQGRDIAHTRDDIEQALPRSRVELTSSSSRAVLPRGGAHIKVRPTPSASSSAASAVPAIEMHREDSRARRSLPSVVSVEMRPHGDSRTRTFINADSSRSDKANDDLESGWRYGGGTGSRDKTSREVSRVENPTVVEGAHVVVDPRRSRTSIATTSEMTTADHSKISDDASEIFDDASEIFHDASEIIDDAYKIFDDASKIFDDASAEILELMERDSFRSWKNNYARSLGQ